MVAADIKYRLFVGHTVFPPLQALHIMIGLLNIGLGEILISSGATWWQMDASGFRYWLGGMVSKLLLYFLSLRNSHMYNTKSLPKLNTTCSTVQRSTKQLFSYRTVWTQSAAVKTGVIINSLFNPQS